MNNNTIELLKFIQINTYDIDYDKTTIVYETASHTVTCHLFIHPSTRKCPRCESSKTLIHDRAIKCINHPILPQHSVSIIFHQIKFQCKDCGKHFMQDNPISPTGKNISLVGELFMLNTLRSPRKTFLDVSREFNVPPTSVIRSFDEHVSIHRHTLTEVICFDEIYSNKLTRTKYALTIFDPMSSTVLDILDNRLKNSLIDYLARIPISERLNVKYVNIDMHRTYKDVAKQAFPNCKICVDSFHAIKHLNKAMDDLRIYTEKKFITTSVDNDNNETKTKTDKYWLLKNFRYYFVQDFDRIKYTWRPNKRYSYLRDKYAVLEAVLKADKTLKDAYYLKEEYRDFNKVCSFKEAGEKLDDLIEKFLSFPYQPFREFGAMLSNWREEIIDSFIRVNGKRC